MRDEETLKKSIVEQLTWDSRIDASDIAVKVKGQKAILDGKVASYADRLTAENIASYVIGINEVENNLEVEFPESFQVPSDEAIKDSISSKIMLNGEIDSTNIKLTVAGGLVTLEGSVSSYWEKIIAENTSQDTTGVIDVTNKLAVVPSEKISDEVVGQRVMDRIEENTLANVDKVGVEVENGKVTLTGVLPSYTVWNSVYNAALYTIGVTDIEDKTTVVYT